jgi:Spy/CpxP family protein refolding chaperone
MVRRKVAIVLAALLLATIPHGIGRTQGFGPGGPGFMMMKHHDFMGGPMMLGTLNLTSDQKTQVQQIMTTLKTNLEPLFQQLHQGHEQITAKLLTPGQLTMADLNPILQQNDSIQQQIEQQKMAAVLQVRSLLRPDQLSKAASVQQKLQQIHAEMKALFNNGDLPPPPEP